MADPTPHPVRRPVRPACPWAARPWALGALAGLAGVFGAVPALAADGFTAADSVASVVGMAADPDHGYYWVPDRTAGRVQALGRDGAVQGSVTYGATPVNVQAITYRNERLWVGDVGDPSGSRKSISVYRFGDLGLGGNAPYRHYSLTYPDGAKDSAAMTVSRNNRIYVATLGAKPGIYRSVAEPSPGGVANQLTRVGDAPADVTDMTFSPDGGLVLRTADAIYAYEVDRFGQTGAAPLPQAARGEAITPSLSGASLLVSGQETPVVMSTVAVPTTVQPITPSPSPTASASASPANSTPSAIAQNRGTLWALALAGVIATAAGAVVALKR
ncbi:hypothetical protein AAEX63_02625 [Luteococcus sp. H138]|uniref:hypothetical protein n=1 Tax=unclassified Luteococcus TaxID=2639923 RepID=UPI00313E6643